MMNVFQCPRHSGGVRQQSLRADTPVRSGDLSLPTDSLRTRSDETAPATGPYSFMCFSATASFGSAVLLLPAGIYCVGEAARKDRRYLALAVLPLAFSIQQFCEGAVWLELANGTGAPPRGAELAYLFFALAFWPFWLPFSVAWFDREHRRLDVLLAAVGFAIGLSLYVPIATRADRFLSVTVSHHSIRYDLVIIPALRAVPLFASRLIYLITVALPLLLCTDRGLRLFGVAILGSGIISQMIFQYAYLSVWCLFAALLSMYLCIYHHGLPERKPALDVRGLQARPAIDT